MSPASTALNNALSALLGDFLRRPASHDVRKHLAAVAAAQGANREVSAPFWSMDRPVSDVNRRRHDSPGGDSEFAEEGADVGCVGLRHLHRHEMVTGVDLRPVHDGVIPLGQSPLEIVRSRDREMPFIFISRSGGEELAVECVDERRASALPQHGDDRLAAVAGINAPETGGAVEHFAAVGRGVVHVLGLGQHARGALELAVGCEGQPQGFEIVGVDVAACAFGHDLPVVFNAEGIGAVGLGVEADDGDVEVLAVEEEPDLGPFSARLTVVRILLDERSERVGR